MRYFEILKSDTSSRARNGIIHTAHGDVNTPAFLSIGTKGAVKAITAEELKFWGAEIILANTYHLWQRPGDALIYKAGGLHKFMNWKGPIFTDSGGFQVFSLTHHREKNRGSSAEAFLSEEALAKSEAKADSVYKVTEAGVTFQFDLDGRTEILSPEKSVQIQANLGSDIALILDDFPGYPFEYERSKSSIELTKRWAERAVKEHRRIVIDGDPINPGQKLWGIVQGASFPDLREKSAKDMVSLGFEGFAIGGVAVGEPHKEMMLAVESVIPHLPESAPKHLLGVGTPFDIVQAVSRGCDTFDCVIPTREARHGRLYVNKRQEVRGKSEEGYATIDIRLEKHKEDFTPVDNTCNCYLCLNHSKSYLRHLFATGEPLATRLATMHNLKFYLNLMKKIRKAIQYEYFEDMVKYYKDYTNEIE